MLSQLVKDRESVLVGNELVDAHCHLDLFAEPQVAAKDARFGGVNLIITAGGSKSSSLAAIRIADGELVFAVIGVDPEWAGSDYSFIGEISSLIKSHKKIVGIGEIGLDYKVGTDRRNQTEVFEMQIDIAKSLDVPIVIHSRGAIEDVIEMVKEKEVKKAIFHFFEGDDEQAVELSRLGYLISIPPIESSRRRRIINELGIDSIAVETDSPVVGKSPLDVIRTVEWIAEIKGISFNEASMRITQNVKKLFSL